MIEDYGFGSIGGSNDWQVKAEYSEELAAAALCPPQIPHDFARAVTRAAAVGNRRVTA
jgi:hypothetical protein